VRRATLASPHVVRDFTRIRQHDVGAGGDDARPEHARPWVGWLEAPLADEHDGNPGQPSGDGAEEIRSGKIGMEDADTVPPELAGEADETAKAPGPCEAVADGEIPHLDAEALHVLHERPVPLQTVHAGCETRPIQPPEDLHEVPLGAAHLEVPDHIGDRPRDVTRTINSGESAHRYTSSGVSGASGLPSGDPRRTKPQRSRNSRISRAFSSGVWVVVSSAISGCRGGS